MKVAVREIKRASAGKSCNLKATSQKAGHKDYKIYKFLKRTLAYLLGLVQHL